ncbi:glycosyltransferase family 4 protein [Bradyrhizobium sp. AUGA SZCCT0431]|uniref:glycosyltransferase family 4 protein n=1 Tax=Bradyrhizobium sp. AUGA SZCCT0431 TaxID=2807674 RepID=UPI001BAC911D|nr:glycosyltransferase family 4 protein [Bradyrhizobium sp. AUGA SZCCT0431]MBR1142625.1 glycosyltransferase family 4 protein [Bradyrhizobium sp. AUGA SZCCT0431]
MRKREIYIFGFRGFPNVQGGVESHVENLAPQLVKLGHRVTACSRSPYADPTGEKEWKGVRLLRLWTLQNTYLEAVLHSLVCTVVAAVRRPLVVHVQGIGPALVTPLLRVLGLRIVVTHHGEDYNREKWGWAARTVLRLGEALGMRFAHKRIAISRSIEKLIATKYGKSCEVIPNGVAFSELPSENDKIRNLGLEPGRYVLTVGRLVPEKRQLDLLRAFADSELVGWKLAIVGRIDHKNKYADLLASEAATMENVVMAGFQTGEALRQLYAHAGLFVLPSSHEGLPIVLLEALGYGLPVLVSDIPSNLEVVGDPGHVFRMGDTQELSAKITALTGEKFDEVQRQAIRHDCYRRYDWTEVARKTSAAYDELIDAKSDDVIARPKPVGKRATNLRLGSAQALAVRSSGTPAADSVRKSNLHG